MLVFDEVITGFRHALGGYQQLCGVTPYLTTLGKAIKSASVPAIRSAARSAASKSALPVESVTPFPSKAGRPARRGSGASRSRRPARSC